MSQAHTTACSSATCAPGPIVAGTDPVALDRVCRGVLDEKRRLAKMNPPLEPLSPYLAHAAELGLGENKLANINVIQNG